jgi:hypothetical protein
MQHKVVLSAVGAVNRVWGEGDARPHKVVLSGVGVVVDEMALSTIGAMN